MYENWKMKKSEIDEKADEYSKVAEWCSENQQYHIEESGEYYVLAEKDVFPEDEILGLKIFLENTDYVVIKIAEGVATAEDYADVLAERAKARQRINELCEQ